MNLNMVTDDEIMDYYAHGIAEQTSGVKDSIPEQADYDLARKVFDLIEKELQR